MVDHESLRPVERCVLPLVAIGVDHMEIARRFRRRPGFVDRVIAYAGMPGNIIQPPGNALRPVKRRILKWRAAGARTPTSAAASIAAPVISDESNNWPTTNSPGDLVRPAE